MLEKLFGKNGKANRCAYIKTIGGRCDAYAQKNSEFCVFHDPEKEDQRAEAKSHGGRKPTFQISLTAEDGEIIDTPEKVLHGLSEVIANLKLQDNSTATARGLVDTYRAVLECLEYTTLKDRLDDLEEKLKVAGV